jgi:hypothetical protein
MKKAVAPTSGSALLMQEAQRKKGKEWIVMEDAEGIDDLARDHSQSSIQDQLMQSFWQQHHRLRDLNDVVQKEYRVGCELHLRDSMVAAAVRELWACSGRVLDVCKQEEKKIDEFKSVLKEAAQGVYSKLMADGRMYLRAYVEEQLAVTFQQLCALHPVHERVRNLAVHLFCEQSRRQLRPLVKYLSLYSKRKFEEVCELNEKQYKKIHEGIRKKTAAATADEAEGSNPDASSHVSTQSAARVWNGSSHQLNFPGEVSTLHTYDGGQNLHGMSIEFMTTVFGASDVFNVTRSSECLNRISEMMLGALEATKVAAQLHAVTRRQHSESQKNEAMAYRHNARMVITFSQERLQSILQVAQGHMELISKTRLEVTKFYTVALPLLLYLDVADPADYLSDCLQEAVRKGLLRLDTMVRVLHSISRATTCGYYEATHGLCGLKELYFGAIVAMLRRIVFARVNNCCASGSTLSINAEEAYCLRGALETEKWYDDYHLQNFITKHLSASFVSLLCTVTKKLG